MNIQQIHSKNYIPSYTSIGWVIPVVSESQKRVGSLLDVPIEPEGLFDPKRYLSPETRHNIRKSLSFLDNNTSSIQ